MKENSKLKKYIDLYVEMGADNTYLYDKLVKIFSDASPEESKEGHEYLSYKLEEKKKNGRKFSREQTKKYKWILGLTLVIVIICIILKNPIMLELEKNNLKNQISTEILNTFQYKAYKLDGKYTNQLTITMNEDFEDYEYTEKTKLIEDVSKKFRVLYNKNKEKLVDKSNKDYGYDEIQGVTKPIVIFVSANNKYQMENSLKKNGNYYLETDYLKEKIVKQLKDSMIENREELINTLNSTKYDKETLSNMYGIQDTKEKTNEIIYQTAKLYSDTDYKKGIELYEKIVGYKDSKDLIESIGRSHLLDGEWTGRGINDFSSNTWIINGDKCYNVFSNKNGYKYNYNTYNCVIDNNTLYIFKTDTSSNDLNNAKYKMKYEEGKLLYEYIPNSNTFITTFAKTSDNTKLKSIEKMQNPSIGMTKAEVEASTWGKPEDINKTTTKYGTREQWCYDGYKYIYFENGVVTSIQD